MSWLSDRTGIHINSINDITSGRAIKEAVKNPLVQIGAGMLIPGVGGAVTGALGKVAGAIPGVGKLAGLAKGLPLSKLGGLVSGGGKDGQGTFGALGDMAGQFAGGGMPGMGGGANGLASTLSQVNIANLNNRANSLQDRAINSATQAYDAKAPLRGMALSGLQNPGAARPNLGGMFGSANPYSKGKTIPGQHTGPLPLRALNGGQ